MAPKSNSHQFVYEGNQGVKIIFSGQCEPILPRIVDWSSLCERRYIHMDTDNSLPNVAPTCSRLSRVLVVMYSTNAAE